MKSFDAGKKVKIVTLKNIVKKYEIEKGILKMDCEGCEYEVFKEINKETLSIIDNIILEYHDHPQFIPDILRKEGFKVTYNEKESIGILKAKRI